jgi:hypothetical protein
VRDSSDYDSQPTGLKKMPSAEVAKHWGVKKVVAEVSKENTRMLTTFRNRGFLLNDEPEQDVVLVSKSVE